MRLQGLNCVFTSCRYKNTELHVAWRNNLGIEDFCFSFGVRKLASTAQHSAYTAEDVIVAAARAAAAFSLSLHNISFRAANQESAAVAATRKNMVGSLKKPICGNLDSMSHGLTVNPILLSRASLCCRIACLPLCSAPLGFSSPAPRAASGMRAL